MAKMSGLNISESTVERTTEKVGEELGALLAAKKTIGPDTKWDWNHDAKGRTVACVSVDATGVRQQGKNGAKAEGRMVTLAMIYNPRGASETKERKPERIERQVRYLAGICDFNELGLQLRKQAAQVDWDSAEQQIALSDGGAGMEEFFRKNFPLAEHILDFWHAKEYLVELKTSLFGESSAEGKEWLDENCHLLKHAGGVAMLAVLLAIDVSSRSAAVQEKLRTTITYYTNHKHKMDYPRYVANGWQIGSGQVESGCNTVINFRLGGAGKRWCKAGTDSVAHLRALYCSEESQWEQFWQTQAC